MNSLSAPSRYRYDDVLIDLGTREIHRGGARVDVEAKVFDLIALLLEARDRALSKRELNAALWGDRAVTDAALSQQLRKARRALGDDGDAQRVIRTVHGRGLRWVAVVEAERADRDSESAHASIRQGPEERPIETTHVAATRAAPARPRTPPRRLDRRWVAFGVAALVLLASGLVLHSVSDRFGSAAPAARRVAVLPVGDRTGEPDLAWTRAGLMGLMTSLLEQAGGLDVLPARNVQAALGSAPVDDTAALAALARALGATHVVGAELRRLGSLYELDLHLLANGAPPRSELLHGSNPAALAADAVARVRRWLDLDRVRAADAAQSGFADAFLAEAYARGLDAELHGDATGAARYFSICLDRNPALAWPRLGLAVAQARSGDPAASLANATQVVAAARTSGDNELRVAGLRQLASLAYAHSDLDTAAKHLDEAFAHLPESGRSAALIGLSVAYGSIEDDRGERARARAHFERALVLARDVGSRRDEASVLINYASLDNGSGDAAAAASALRAGLDAARAAGDAQLEGAALANLGATEANQGHLLDAVALLKKAVAGARKRGDSAEAMQATAQLVWALAPFGKDTTAALARAMLASARSERNPFWEAEAQWALADLAARRHAWNDAFDGYASAQASYANAGVRRSVAPVLADAVSAAVDAGDAARAQAAAAAFRSLTDQGGDAASWRTRLPLIDAQLHALTDKAGAADELARALDTLRGQPGPAAQAMLFQLGRWQLDLDRGADLLARPEWKPWWTGHPDAIALRVAALRATGAATEADAEQQRLDALRASAELDIDASLLAF